MNLSPAGLAAILLLTGLAPRVVHAQSVEVEGLLRRGVELRRQGHDEDAVAPFAEAYRLQPSPRTAAQLGLVQQALGRWSEADGLLREALAAPDDPWVRRNRAVLDGALAVATQHIGELDLRCDTAGARVSVDGRAEQPLPLAAPLRLVAGELSFEVRAEGYEAARRRLVLLPGQRLRERVELRPVESVPPPSPAPPVVVASPPVVRPPPTPQPAERPTLGASRRGAAIGLFAGSAAALAFGIAAVVVREDLAADFNATCPGVPPDPVRCEDVRASAGSWTVGAAVSLPLAALMSAGAIALLALPARTTARAASTGPRLGVAVVPAPTPLAAVRLTF